MNKLIQEEYMKKLENNTNKISKYYSNLKIDNLNNNYIILHIRKEKNLTTSDHMSMIYK